MLLRVLIRLNKVFKYLNRSWINWSIRIASFQPRIMYSIGRSIILDSLQRNTESKLIGWWKISMRKEMSKIKGIGLRRKNWGRSINMSSKRKNFSLREKFLSLSKNCCKLEDCKMLFLGRLPWRENDELSMLIIFYSFNYWYKKYNADQST
jgi:hypothetical protein